MANNPGPFTFKGHVSYIVGRGNVAIVDPGPEDAVHTQALLDAVKGEKVTHIFVTPRIATTRRRCGDEGTDRGDGLRRRPHRASRPLHIGEHNPLDPSGDRDFQPDVQFKDGDVVEGDGWAIEAVTTPGQPSITWPTR